MASEEIQKIGVYVCECGPNIAQSVDLDRVVTALSANPNVAVVKRYKLLCSEDGKQFLAKDIADEKLTHVVVAACSPKDHEATFAGVCARAGINPYLYQIINIREHCAWIIKNKEAATDKAISYIDAGVSRVLYHVPLVQKELDSVPDVLVLGGGIAGIETALSLASPVRQVHLVEKSDALGGASTKLAGLYKHQLAAQNILKEKIAKVTDNPNIHIHLNSELTKAIGFFGNFETTVQPAGGEPIELNVGAIVVATGFTQYDPAEDARWGYGKVANVATAMQAEEMLATGKLALANGSAPKSVALIHCVGRDAVGYCSAVCCNYLMKIAAHIRERCPEAKVSDIYRDLCMPNKSDQRTFGQVRDSGVEFIRGDNVRISQGGGAIEVKYTNDAGEEKSCTVDMAILAPAMKPCADTAKLAEMLDIPLDKSGFFEEEHLCLAPVSTTVNGVFIVGCAHGPKNISDSMVQARAAAGTILARLIPGKKLLPEVKVSEIIETLCTGCQNCVTVCPYGAATYNEEKHVSVINEAICRGCGNCVGSCPSGAARSKHFTHIQLHQEVIEALAHAIGTRT